MMKKNKKKDASESSNCGPYTVILFIEENKDKSFDCIPDVWFTDESKESCLWPPSKGKNVAIRALKQEVPDDSWITYECEVVKGGFATYSCGRAFVREKCAQKYNTSSAEDHEAAAKFRRLHPVLSNKNMESFEDVFGNKKRVKRNENHQTEENTGVQKPSNDDDPEKSSNYRTISTIIDANVSQKAATNSSHPGTSSSASVISYRTMNRQCGSKSRELGNEDISCEESSTSNRSPMQRDSTRRSASRSTRSHRDSRSISRNSTRSGSCSSRRSRSNTSRGSSRSNGRPHKGRDSRSISRETEGSGGRSICSRTSSVSSGPKNSPNRLRKEKYDRNSERPTVSVPLPLDTSRKTARNMSSNDRRNNGRCRSRSKQSRSFSVSNEAKHSSVRLEKEKYRQSSNRAYVKDALPLEGSCRKAAADRHLLSRQSTDALLQSLMQEVRALSKAVVKHQHQNDRRLARMEVSVNKALVRLGDITRSSATHLSNDLEDTSTQRKASSGESSYHGMSGFSSGQGSRNENLRTNFGQNLQRSMLREHESLDVPIKVLSELVDANHRLKNKEFFSFLVDQEMEFCTPDKNTSHTLVITTYLKRFISLRVRNLLTLKELKKNNDGSTGLTLYADFYNVYDFLITVMCAAYKSCKKSITRKEANEALRIVWGRSKQMLNDEKKRLT